MMMVMICTRRDTAGNAKHAPLCLAGAPIAIMIMTTISVTRIYLHEQLCIHFAGIRSALLAVCKGFTKLLAATTPDIG